MSKRDKYKCPTCKRKFLRSDGPTYSCCVQHGPGECCHAFEVEVHKKGWAKPLAQQPMTVRPWDGAMGSASTSVAPWCSICAGWHLPGMGACTANYSVVS